MYELDKAKFGAFIARLRKGIGYTHKELAKQLQIPDKAVGKWKTGVSHTYGCHTMRLRLHDFQKIKFCRKGIL